VLYGEPAPCRQGLFTFGSGLENGLPTFRFCYGPKGISRARLLQYLAAALLAFRKVTAIWGTPDVIHAQEPASAFAALLLRLWGRIPYVVSEHWTGFGRRNLTLPNLMLARWAFSGASRILGDNRKFPADFQHYGISCDFRWLPNCMDTTLFYATEQERDLVVLHCSLFDTKKRVPDLIEAFARCQPELPGVKLELIGDGPGRAAAEQLAHRVLIPGSFTFHGLQAKQFIADAMRKASVLVLCSAEENLPCVLIEAMSCGTPIVATNVGDIDHIVGVEQGILVERGDIQGLAQAIKKVMTREKSFNYQKIAEYAAHNFSHEHIGRILHEEHVRAVINSKKNQKPQEL
jgi:glycosyltransferase involved in cell wall biosynthesis